MIGILSALFSCNSYKVVEKQIHKKMDSAGMELKLKEISGDIIEYWDNESDMPVIVLVHGFGATTMYQWYRQIDELQEKYRVVMPNLFHFGKSVPGSEKFQIDDQVDMVHALLKELNISEYIICGVSYGGLVSLELANKFPSEVNKIILFDTPIKFMKASDIHDVCAYFDVNSVEELFVPEHHRGLKKLMYLASGKKSIVPAFMLKGFYEKNYARNFSDKRKLMSALLSGLEEFSKREYKVTVPTLIVWGEHDKVVPLERGRVLSNYLGDNAEFHVINDAAHMPNVSHYKEFNQILTDFLIR